MESQTPEPESDLGFDLLSPLDDRPGPAQRISSRRAAEMVQAALTADTAMTQRAADVRQAVRVAAAIAVLLIAGTVVAAVYRILQRPEAPPLTAPPALAPVATPPTQPAQVEEAPDAKTIEAIKEATRTASTPQRRSAPAAKREASEPAAVPAAAAVPVTVPVEDLLRLANEQRRGQHWREADALYQRVLHVHPHTPAAYVAGVASATLHLERLDDAHGALRLYQAALHSQPHGSLAAEARYGLADTYHALGDAKAEAQALRDFIAEHADSPLRPRAEARLTKLSPSTPAP